MICSPLTRLLGSLCAALLLGSAGHAQEWGPWWGLGPFDEPGGATSLGTEHAPERTLGAMQAGGAGPDLALRYRGKGGAELRWAPLDLPDPDPTGIDVGRIDLIRALPQVAEVAGGAENVVAYLYRRIECEGAARVALSIGSDDGLRLWLDGRLLIDRPVARAVNVRDHSLVLELGPGTHHLLAKVAQGGGGWALEMRPWQPVSQEAVDAAIDRGVRFLLERQLLDGSWASREEWGAGYTAFCLYTLLKCGLSPEHAAARRALEYVRARPPTTTYAAATALLAFAELPGDELRPAMEQALAALIEWQEHHGRYGYPIYPGGSRPPADLSNTLFAALALRAAAQSGLRVPDKTWRQLAEGTLGCQERAPRNQAPATGGRALPLGFSYREREKSTGSMTTAAISILAIARENLGSRLGAPLSLRIEQAIQSGLAWLEHHGEWGRNPNHGWHHYYYIYGLERVGALLGVERLAGCTWYPDGAEVLVKAQTAEGSWRSFDQREYDDTLLALLFLKRATHVTTGGQRAGGRGAYVTQEADAEVRLRASGDRRLTLWVEGFSAALAQSLEWPGEQGRGPRVTRVEFLARFLDEAESSEGLLGEQPGHADRPVGDSRFALRTELERRGRWGLRARVHVLEPPPDDVLTPRSRVLESPELEVRVENVLAPAALRYARESPANQLRTERFAAEASSQAGGDQAAQAFDGRQGTSWRCDPADAEPWVRITPERPVRALRLALSHAVPRADGLAQPRARRVEVLVNGRDSFTLELDPDPLTKTELVFERLQRVRRLEVRVLESVGRTLGQDSVGFAEIELFLER